ncbi:MAG: TRAP transporter small permease [Tropicimonas sp.]|uniref:TRAP transporter small permease n=1 Tax=Tropicimonas sp. TaxID=2067044 RepID=UPI003A8642DE
MTSSENPETRSTDTGFAAALQGAADIAALAGAWVAGLCIAALTVLVLVDTIMAFLSRYIPALPSGTGIGWEYSAYLMGSAFVLGSGLTLRAGLQLRVSVLVSTKMHRLTRLLEIFASALGSVVTVFLTVWLARFTMRTYGYGEVSQDSFTPLWIPQLVLTIGIASLAFQMIARLVSGLSGNEMNKPDLGVTSAVE